MKTKFLLLLSLLFLTCVQPVCADTVIPLSLVEDSNDGPAQDGKDPVTPNQFAALLNNRTLSVITTVKDIVYIKIQKETTNETIVDSRFYNSFSYKLSDYGLYSLILFCGETKLKGIFYIELSQDDAADIVLKMFEEENVDIYVSNNKYKQGDTINVCNDDRRNNYIVANSYTWVAYVDLFPLANLSHEFQYILIDPFSGKVQIFDRDMPPYGSDYFKYKQYKFYDSGIKIYNQQDAFEVVDSLYKNKEVGIYMSKDYYSGGEIIELLNNKNIRVPYPASMYWVAFVDLHPIESWTHECVYVFISAYSHTITKVTETIFPKNLEDLFVLKRWDNEQKESGLILPAEVIVSPYTQGNVSKTPTKNYISANSPNSHENNKWAIIINGGYNLQSNWIRYWNNCSAVYKTLLNYGYSPEKIFVAISDGLNDGVDRRDYNNIYTNSPWDLDGDGNNDVQYPATRNGIINMFSAIGSVMNEGDELFIFTTDHGETNGNNSSLLLWNQEVMFDYEFANLIESLHAGQVNIVMEQCKSGGFIDDFQNSTFNQIVITTACSALQNSYSSLEKEYDEFIYWWCTAVNGITPNGILQGSADYNFDGYISMREAYRFACEHDRRDESPQQYSNDVCLKYSLTLANLLNLCDDAITFNGSDIYIKDNNADFGAEPNITTNKQWISTDIWFEELNGGQVNSLQQGSTYKVCARIYNRGNQDSPGGELIYWHWTKAVIGGSWPYSWFDDYDYYCDNTPIIRGAVINPYGTVIPSIGAGESTIVYDYWTVPVLDYSICSVFDDDLDQLWHYCLLARIIDLQDQPGEDMEAQALPSLVLNHNNVASRNFSILSDLNTSSEDLPAAIVGVTPPNMQSDYYHIYCDLLDTTMELGGNVHLYVTLSPDMYSNWLLHGSGFYDIDGLGRLEITANHAELLDIYMNGSELYPIKVEIEQTSNLFCDVQFDIYLVNQHDSILGGERFRYNGDGTNRFVINPSISDSQHASHSQSGFDITCTPNPVTSTLFVSSSEEIISIDIYDIDGKNVISTGETTIDVSRLSKGIYMVIAESANGYGQTKFVKQ